MKYLPTISLLLILLLLPLAGCERNDTLPTSAMVQEEAAVEAEAVLSKSAAEKAAIDRIVAQVDAVNARLGDGESELQLDYPWLFRVGAGTDPFARLRTGARWTTSTPEYVIDASDYSSDVAAPQQEAALVQAFESWNNVSRTYIQTTRVPDAAGDNPDVLDGTIAGGICLNLLDVTSPQVDLTADTFEPTTDILVGGWLEPEYFELCLGGEDILGVTWTFSGADTNGDRYRDILYVEQFYNDGFNWVTENSVFLDPIGDPKMDIETIAVHENGHALGLGHFGGPVNRQPFTLKPDGRVFNPEAVMNPFYLGGEKRSPLPTDLSGLTTLYTGHVSTTNQVLRKD